MDPRQNCSVEIEDGSVTPPPSKHICNLVELNLSLNPPTQDVLVLDGLGSTNTQKSITYNFLKYFVSLNEKKQIHDLLTKLANDQISIKFKTNLYFDLQYIKKLYLQIQHGDVQSTELNLFRSDFFLLTNINESVACEFANNLVKLNKQIKSLAENNFTNERMSELRKYIKTIAQYVKTIFESVFSKQQTNAAARSSTMPSSKKTAEQLNVISDNLLDLHRQGESLISQGDTLMQSIFDSNPQLKTKFPNGLPNIGFFDRHSSSFAAASSQAHSAKKTNSPNHSAAPYKKQ